MLPSGIAIPPGVKALVFDIGNVLIAYDDYRVARKVKTLTGSEMTEAEIYSAIFRSAPSIAYLSGQGGIEPYYRHIRQVFGFDLSMEQFAQIFHVTFFDPNREMLNLYLSCQDQGLRLGVLTDMNPSNMRYLRETHVWFDQADALVASCDIGQRKPHAAMYEAMEEALSLPKDQLLFFDDKPGNVQMARERGWHAQEYMAPR